MHKAPTIKHGTSYCLTWLINWWWWWWWWWKTL